MWGGDAMRDRLFFHALLLLVVCGSLGPAVSAEDNCAPSGDLSFVCGPTSVEDLVIVPGTHWLIGSGMMEGRTPGKLHLINAVNKTWEVLYPGPAAHNVPDRINFPSCPGSPDPSAFGAHGIAISGDGGKKSVILAVNHGREAIEVFHLDASGAKPVISWVGCVSMGETNFGNSVAFLPDGGFVATKFYDTKAPGGVASIFAGGTTGGVTEWHPKTGLKTLPGTDVAGANGIEVSGNGKFIYVAAWGSQELVRYSRGTGPLRKDVVKLGFCPDNLRWTADRKLIIAGQNTVPGVSDRGFPKFKGWTVVKLDPDTLKFTQVAKDDGSSPFQNVSAAVELDSTLWLGVYAGNRVAYRRSR